MILDNLFPKFDFDLERKPVLIDHVRENMPNYDKAEEVERIDVGSLGKREFHENYVRKCRPVVLAGALEKWPAFANWDDGYLKEKGGDADVTVTNCLMLDFLLMAATKRLSKKRYWEERKKWITEMSLADYVDSQTVDFDESRIFYARDIAIPDVLAKEVGEIPVYDGKLQAKTWFVGRRSFTDSHEHHGADAFLCQVRGSKEVIMHSPSKRHYKAMYGNMALKLWSPVRLFDVDKKAFPLFEESKPHKVIVEEGDALFIPDPWWHAVMSADDKLDITITMWCDPPSLNLTHPQTRRQFVEAPLNAVRNAWHYGLSFDNTIFT